MTERQSAMLAVIEDEVGSRSPPPNTVELARATGTSTGKLVPVLDALEYMGVPIRIRGRRRNIRRCSPSVAMAPDEHLVCEPTRRFYLVRRAQHP